MTEEIQDRINKYDGFIVGNDEYEEYLLALFEMYRFVKYSYNNTFIKQIENQLKKELDDLDENTEIEYIEEVNPAITVTRKVLVWKDE